MKAYRFDCEVFEKELYHSLGFCFANSLTEAVYKIEKSHTGIVEIKIYGYDTRFEDILLDADDINILDGTYDGGAGEEREKLC